MLRYLLAALLLLLTACGGSVTETDTAATTPTAPAASDGFAALPADGVQPWERVDSRGYVVPPQPQRGTSAFAPTAHFQPGVERFSSVGNVVDDADVSVVIAGTGSLSGAIYRFPMGGVQPGAVAVDVNLRTAGGQRSQFWVGLSNYTRGVWDWSGPYDDGQITQVVVAGSNNLSGTGTFYVAVAGTDEAQFDIVGVAVSPRDSGDTTAPPVPMGLTATPVQGGLELAWNDVLAADLAGYHLHWSYSPFTTSSDNGVNTLQAVENTTRAVLPSTQKRDVYVALSAVDVNGNASAISDVVRSQRLTPQGAAGPLEVLTDAASVQRGLPATLTASGAELYDFDLDGDGTYEVTDDATGSAAIDTSATGIIRPRVRAHSADGTAVAFGSVSLIVSGNQRPVANAQCTPQTGTAPLNVQMNGTGADFDGSIAEYAWDFDGDGIYDHNSPADGITAETYTAPGLYNAKLRVTDDLGAWDVDTVAISVLSKGATLSAHPSNPAAGETFTLTAEVPGSPDDYEWDLDGDGSYETGSMGNPTYQLSQPVPGAYTYRVRATYASGPAVLGETKVTVGGWFTTVADPDHLGDVSSLVMVNGHPAVTYTNFDLWYVRANDPEGRTWGTPQMIEGGASWSSMLVHNGVPQICFSDGGQLHYIRATDANGSAWDTATVIAGATPSISRVETKIVNGNPAVTFHTGAAVRYARASNVDGTAWNAPTDVFVGPVGFSGSTLQIADGQPAIAWYDNTNLQYSRALDVDGTAWAAPVTVVFGAGSYAVLEIVNGHPAVACKDAAGNVHYSRALDPQGASWGVGQNISLSPNNSWISLGVVNGLPAVAYSVIGGLQYARAYDVNGQTWASPVNLIGQSANYPRLAEINGRASVSYYSASDLYYSRLY